MSDSFLQMLPLSGIVGYAILFALAFLESCAFIGVFVPGQIVVALAGFLAAHGYLNAYDCLWVVSVAVVMGESLSYYLGTLARSGYLERHHRLLRLKEKYLPATDAYFHSHGGKTVIIGRFVGVLRAFTPFVAGMARMSYFRFLIFSALGGTLWAGVFIAAGYVFGESWRLFERWSGRAGAALVLILIAVGIVWLIRARAKARRPYPEAGDSSAAAGV